MRKPRKPERFDEDRGPEYPPSPEDSNAGDGNYGWDYGPYDRGRHLDDHRERRPYGDFGPDRDWDDGGWRRR